MRNLNFEIPALGSETEPRFLRVTVVGSGKRAYANFSVENPNTGKRELLFSMEAGVRRQRQLQRLLDRMRILGLRKES